MEIPQLQLTLLEIFHLSFVGVRAKYSYVSKFLLWLLQRGIFVWRMKVEYSIGVRPVVWSQQLNDEKQGKSSKDYSRVC
jgi:hypothetical protein